PKVGTIASVKQRIEESQRIARISLVDAAQAWSAAIAAIGAPNSEYLGLVIAPQVGLVPIGQDPESKYWEFAHVASGNVPSRAINGVVQVSAGDGIVLMLVPGGTFRMGTPPTEGAVGGALPSPDEKPMTEVKLAPFFIARYETTRAQWQRMSGSEVLHDQR